MKTKAMLIFVLGCVAVATLACNPEPKPTGTPPVVQLMPDLTGHHVIEGQAVQEYIMGLAEGAALLTGHPELAALITKVDRVIACYQEVGAINARIYSDESWPLSSGAIAIADRNRLTDPATLFRCLGGEVIPFSDQPALNPCSHKYTLERDNNAFYIIYVGTTQEICHDFCVNLEGCSAH
jgi:hypothetical protein